jgi:hypothetical protein
LSATARYRRARLKGWLSRILPESTCSPSWIAVELEREER